MNQVALVTGGSRGIGRGIAERLAGAGYSVVITSRHPADEQAQAKFLCIQADVSDADDRARTVEAAIGRFGRIDLLVNNAGMAPRVRADILDMSVESMREVLDVNLIGPFFLTQLVARRMMDQGRGMIINISSLSAYAASIQRGEYCISKAGVSMMTQLYAVRLAEHGIPVYEIRPGIIRTDMTLSVAAKYDALIEGGLTPIRRWGTPEDVARAVEMLSQGLLPFSTGPDGIAPIDALFTATSAVCVTGLVVVDTGTVFSLAGQIVVALLIQIGGLGVMTFSVLLFLTLGKRVSFRHRLIMQEVFAHTPREDIYKVVQSI
jgi:NAD(P)-dependent dehydrogenase (short-subunit alcohol dehydrogenase family)